MKCENTSSRDNNESVMKKTVNSLRKKVLSIEDSVVHETQYQKEEQRTTLFDFNENR